MVQDYGDYGLLACSLVTGMVDGASFLNWGVFVGMQTGKCFSINLVVVNDCEVAANDGWMCIYIYSTHAMLDASHLIASILTPSQATPSFLVCPPQASQICPMRGSPPWSPS